MQIKPLSVIVLIAVLGINVHTASAASEKIMSPIKLDVDSKQRTTEVSSVVHAFADAWNRHDMNAFSKLFAENAEFVNVVGIWWKGRSEMCDSHQKKLQFRAVAGC